MNTQSTANPTCDALFELGCEELPAKGLQALAQSFKQSMQAALDKAKLSCSDIKVFVTPRRIALHFLKVDSMQPDVSNTRRGPAVAAAYDKAGDPTPAALGFAKSCGVEIGQLKTLKTDKGEWLAFDVEQKGLPLAECLPSMIADALTTLPLPKRMHWGDSEVAFLRPIQWMLLMVDDKAIKITILGFETDALTYGHRMHHPNPISLKTISEYESQLEKAKVVADFDTRRERIDKALHEQAKALQASLRDTPELLDEVTGLVEWPVVMTGTYDSDFLQVPKEALISVMHDHQKCFPLFDQQDNLKPAFLLVSNIESTHPTSVVHGNERVMRARMSDAQFFYTQDLKTPLPDHCEALKGVKFQKDLGSLYDKTQRVTKLSTHIASLLGGDANETTRAATLCKTDLLTEMVGEFPECQGVMGQYYARAGGEPEAVAIAIREHYLPRFSGDELPETKVGMAVALADKLDTIVGIFGVNCKPTGVKDPFSVRRSAIGVLRILIENDLSINLLDLIRDSYEAFSPTLANDNTIDEVFEYMMERLRAWYREQSFAADSFMAVLARKPESPLDFHHRMLAVDAFRALPQASALAQANKRVSRILQKQSQDFTAIEVKPQLFESDYERDLSKALSDMNHKVEPALKARHYKEALTELSTLGGVVDAFFDNVMVMTDEADKRNNRLSMLVHLRELFLKVADISLLQD